MLAMVGETFGDKGQVMGAVVSVRRTQDKLAVWTQWCAPEHEETIKSIGYAVTMAAEKRWPGKDIADHSCDGSNKSLNCEKNQGVILIPED